MLRNEKQLTRLYFIIVLGMALLGSRYASLYWQLSFDLNSLSASSGRIDWIDLVSKIGEAAIQLLLGVTSPKG